MSSRNPQVRYQRKTTSLRDAVGAARKTDVALRMRNEMAMALDNGERIIDDDFVAITRAGELDRRNARKSLPTVGIVLATNRRLRMVTIEDGEQILDTDLDQVNLAHDEDTALTMAIRQVGHAPEVISLTFLRRRDPVATYLRSRLKGDKSRGTRLKLLRRVRRTIGRG